MERAIDLSMGGRKGQTWDIRRGHLEPEVRTAAMPAGVRRPALQVTGSLWGLVGLGFVMAGFHASPNVERAARLPAITAADLPRLTPGTRVAATGTIGFLGQLRPVPDWRARREDRPGEEGRPDRQFCYLCRDGAALPVLNDGVGLGPELSRPNSEDLPQPLSPAGDGGQGIRCGDIVTIAGTVEKGTGGTALRPEKLFRGSPEQLIGRRQAGRWLGLWFGFLALLFGVAQVTGVSLAGAMPQ